MEIEEVHIQNFRNFRSETVVANISSSLNVLVGKNNSGKSNFLRALQFVLNPRRLKPVEQRLVPNEALTSDETSVSVTFISEVGTKVSLKRVLTLNSDSFYMDGKNISRGDMKLFISLIGFHESALPTYYICFPNISEIQQLIENNLMYYLVTLVQPRIYISLSSLKKVFDSLCEFLNNLNALATTSEMSMDDHSLKDDAQSTENLESLLLVQNSLKCGLYDKIIKKKEEKKAEILECLKTTRSHTKSTRTSELLRQCRNEFDRVQSRLSTLIERKEELFSQLEKKRLKLTRITSQMERAAQVDDGNEKKKLQISHLNYESEMKIVTESRDKIIKRISKLEECLETARRKRLVVLSRINMKEHPTTSSQGTSLEIQLRAIEKELQQLEKLKENAIENKNATQSQIQFWESKIQMLTAKSPDLLAAKKNKLTDEYNHVKGDLQSLQRKEYELNASVDGMHYNLNKAKHEFCKTFGKGVLAGWDSVKKVVQSLPADKVQGYRGVVADLLTAPEQFNLVLKSALGKRIFYHITDTISLSTEITKKVNEQKLPGEIWFAASDVVTIPTKIVINRNDVAPLLTLVSYPSEVANVMEHLLTNVFICKTLEVATYVSRNYGVTCLTFDGDKVSRSGLMSGGYQSSKSASMTLRSAIVDEEKKLLAAEKAREEIRQQIVEKQSSMDAIFTLLSALKIDRKRYFEKLNNLDVLRRNLDYNKQVLRSQEIKISDYDVRIAACKKCHHDLMYIILEDVPSQEERSGTKFLSVEDYNNLIKKFKKKIESENYEKMSVDGKITKIQQILNNISESIAAQIFVEEDNEKRQTAFQTTENEINNIELNLTDIENQIEYCQEEFEESKQKLKEAKQLKDRWDVERYTSMEEISEEKLLGDLESINQTIKHFEQAKTRILSKCNKNIFMEPLSASIPTSMIRDKINELNGKITELRSTLEGRNMKARTHLKRKKALLYNFNRLLNIYESLKSEFDKTYQQFSRTIPTEIVQDFDRHFESLFLRFFPSGVAQVVHEPPTSEVQVRGKGLMGTCQIKAGWNSQCEDLSYLSGGQKSIVAICLVLAAAIISPDTRLLLFDDVLFALDESHRGNFIKVLKDISNQLQIVMSACSSDLATVADKTFEFSILNQTTRIDVLMPEEAARAVARSGHSFILTDNSAFSQ